MKGRPIDWTDEGLAWIEATSRDFPSRRAQHQEFQRRFSRPDIGFGAFKGLCSRKRWPTGRDGRFYPGQVPPNKGKRVGSHPNSARTQFKPGIRQGRAAGLHQPIGAERISKDGYPERKINDDMPFHRRWRAIHLIEWEAANGPIPAGHALKCLDGDRANTSPDNWIAIPRALLPRLSASKRGINYDPAPPELRPALLAIARLEHAARERRRGRERGAGP